MPNGKAPQVGDDKRMIDESKWWPQWPQLPVKSRTKQDPHIRGMGLCGVIVDDDRYRKGHRRVYLTTIFEPVTDETSHTDYGDTDTMLRDGWIVD